MSGSPTLLTPSLRVLTQEKAVRLSRKACQVHKRSVLRRLAVFAVATATALPFGAGWGALGAADCPEPPLNEKGNVCPPLFGILDYGPDAGRFPRVVTAADMDGDGRMDLITGNRDFNDASAVAVLLTQNDRGFRVVNNEADEDLKDLIVADLDGDGDLDVATASEDQLLVLENTGGGRLGAPGVVTADSRTRTIAAVDLDGDGLPELLSTSQTSDTVSSYPNLGGLRFTTPRTTSAPGRPAAILAADLDADGTPEIVVADGSGARVLVFATSETGGLIENSPYLLGGATPASLQSSDMDGDGILDLVVGIDRAVAVLRGTGETGLEPAIVLDVITSTASNVVVADANGDALPDILIGRSSPNEAIVFVGDGSGGFEPVPVDLWVVPRALAAADLDGDADVELVALGVSLERPAILWGGEPHVTPPPTFSRREVSLGARPHGADLGDFNNDGIVDIVTSSGDDVTIAVLLSETTSPLARRSNMTIPGTGRTFGAATADLDGDGDIDIAVGDNEVDVVGVLINRGDGTFERGVTYGGVVRPRQIIAAELTGDEGVDLVTADSDANKLSLLRNRGDGTFDPPLSIPVGTQPLAMVAADLDGDGVPELVAANSVSKDISILVRQGGNFEPHALLFTIGQPRDVLAVDLDGDGDLDLATANGVTNDLNVFLNEGAVNFAAPLSFPGGRFPYSLATGDFNGDGVPDLVTGNSQADSASLFLGAGGGDFHVPFRYDVGREPRFVMAADFDLDGRTDLVTANRQSRDVSLLTNTAGRTALFRRSDVDGDGRYTVADALGVLRYLVGGADMLCLKSADGNDDGVVDLSDALHITNHLFLRGPAPPLPGSTCGSDPTPDTLSCTAHACANDF